MATVTLKPTITDISQTLACENNTSHLRDASFSSYISNEETFVPKLAEPTQNTSLHHMTLGRRKTADGEIGIFGAEKYFNERADEDKPRIVERDARKHQTKKDEEVNLHHMKSGIKMGTPSSASDVSYNSQCALFPSFLKDKSPSGQDRVHGKRFLAGFGINCPCSSEKSVDIDQNIERDSSAGKSKKIFNCGVIHNKEITEEPIHMDRNLVKRTPSKSWLKEEKEGVGLNTEECFTFPVLNSGVGNSTTKRQAEEEVEREKPRKSLEVFGSPLLEERDIALSLEKKLTMLSWDANPRADEIPAISDDDIESDSSSDLFEIQSLTGNANSFLSRHISDGKSSCLTPTCYEPSEASIEWSVVTASAANFSAVSDYDEHIPGVITTNNTTKTKITPSKEEQRRRPSMFLGCKSHKALKVAGDAYKIVEKAKPNSQRHTRTRYQAENKVTDFESAHAQRAFGARTVSMSRSTHASPSLYMH